MPLQRRLYRIDALAIALSTVIGIGVFRNTGMVLRGAGGFTGATLLWLVSGVLVLGGAVLYADLSGRVPEAGGPYAYVRVAFGGKAAFAYGWMNAGVAIPARQASTAAITGELLAKWIPMSPRVLALTLYLALAAIHLFGVRAGAIAQRIFTVGKLLTIMLVVVLAVALGVMGNGMTGESAPAAATMLPAATFGLALSAVWYAYLGWQDVVLLAEELYEPRRDLPVVMIGTVLLVMVLFIALHATVYWGLGGGADAYALFPALHVASRMLDGFGDNLLRVLMVLSLIGVTAGGLLVRPRIGMALARDGLGPAPLTRVSRVGTPYVALALQVAISAALVATGSYDKLLELISFTMGTLGLFEIASYFVVRRKRPELPTSRLHPWAPLAFLIMSGALCVLSGWDHPWGIVTAFGILLAITIIYVIAQPRTIPAEAAPIAPDLPEARARAGTPRPDAET
ncbi:MAG TPA: amino acid permease [Kofleriaceae bacterium]|nr:amino acid permease [Kofleriaceae bacterium]